jgi:excisionase family DNA binding protein
MRVGGDKVTERLAVTVPQAAEMLGLGRTKVWQLVRRGRLRSLRVGKRVLVPVRELERFLTEAMAEAENGR